MKNWMTIIREHRLPGGGDAIAVIEREGAFFCVGVCWSFVLVPHGKGLVTLERARKRQSGMASGATICSFSPAGLEVCATARTRKGAMAAFRREVARRQERVTL